MPIYQAIKRVYGIMAVTIDNWIMRTMDLNRLIQWLFHDFTLILHQNN